MILTARSGERSYSFLAIKEKEHGLGVEQMCFLRLPAKMASGRTLNTSDM